MSTLMAPAQCAWKIDDQVSLFVDEIEPDVFRLSMEHRTDNTLDGIVSTTMSKGRLQAYAKLLQAFLQD